MKKFIAQTIFEIDKAGTSVTEFDIQYRMVTAVDSDTALTKAIHHAKAQEGPVTPMEGPDLFWRFVGITNLFDLEGVEDGGEIFTQTYQTRDPNLYIRFVKQRSMAIQTQQSIGK